MRKISIIICISLLGIIAKATTYTFVPTVPGAVASNSLNWSPAGVPTATDDVVFNGLSLLDCDWDIAVVNSMSLLTGYSHEVDLSSAGSVTLSGNLVINSGTLTAPSFGTIEFASSISQNFNVGSSGVFITGGGNVVLSISPGNTFNFAGNIDINNIVVSNTAAGSRNINFGSPTFTLNVNGMNLINGAAEHSYQGTVHIKNRLFMDGSTFTTVPANNTATFIFDGPSASVRGQTSAGLGRIANIQINTSGNLTLRNNISITGSWEGNGGTLQSTPLSTVNLYAGAVISGTNIVFNSLATRGANVSITATSNLNISGNVINSGSFANSSSKIFNFNGGSTSQTISGNVLDAGSVLMANGTRSVTITGSMTVADSLKVGNNVTFSTGNALTLKSTSALKARVAQLGSGASISGNVTVQTFIPGGSTGWANLGIAGVNGQTVGNWASQMPMTCNGCPNGTTAVPGGFASVVEWDEPTDGYITASSTTGLTPGKGFWVYVGSGFSTTTDFTLNNTGSLVQGTGSIPVSASGGSYNLVANPYASPISWTKLRATGSNSVLLANAIYVWNADLASGAGATTSFINGVSDPGGAGSITDVIPAGQSFYVEATGAGNISYGETIKTTANTSANPLLRSSQNTSDLYGKVFRLKISGANDWDATTFRLHPYTTSRFDKEWDARKIFQTPGYAGYPGVYKNYTTISSKDDLNEDYSIQSIPTITQRTTIPVLVRVSASGTYTLSGSDLENADDCVLLHDKQTNIITDLKSKDYVVSIDDTTSTPRFELILCKYQAAPVSVNELLYSNSILINQNSQGAYVNTLFSENTTATISVYNVIGQKIMEDLTVEGKENTTLLNLNLHNQIVIVRVTTDKESFTKKMVLH